jgi:hypothetical protein
MNDLSKDRDLSVVGLSFSITIYYKNTPAMPCLCDNALNDIVWCDAIIRS